LVKFISRSMTRALLVVAVAFGAGLQAVPLERAAAQVDSVAIRCQERADSLGAGARDGLHWRYIDNCGANGAAALASRLATLTSETDTIYLGELLPVLTSVRAPALFEAARALANNTSATTAARVVGLATLIAQYTLAKDFISDKGWAATLNTPRGRNCLLGYAGGTPVFQTSLPSGYQAAMAATLDSIELRPGENAVVRDLAGCVRRLIDEIPVNPPASALTMSYVCGTRFSVTNASVRPAELTYTVSSDTAEYDLYVKPANSATFFTLRSGTVSLSLNGTVILTARNAGKGCP
jgi:hypothetical protein